MANEVDNELTSTVNDPSSGSLLGDKTTGEGDVDSSSDSSPETGGKDKDDKMRLLSSTQTGTVPHSEPESNIKEDEENANNSGNRERGICARAMANKVDSELTSTVNDPSSGSLLGDKTTGEGDVDSSSDSSPETGGKDKDDKMRLLSSTQTGTVPHSEPESNIKEDEENANNSGNRERDNRIVATSETKISKETEKARDINERGDGFKDMDNADKEMGKDEDLNREAEKESTLILEDKMRLLSSTQTGTVPHSEPESNIKEDEEVANNTPILEESLQHKSSGFPRESQPQIRVGGNDKKLWICAFVVLLASVVCGKLYLYDSTPPVPKKLNVVDLFNQQMEKLKTSFPNQRPELWRRSLIHLRRHLKTEQPTEPVSLILTSGHRAERTLGCLAQCLAHAFSTARNSSVLNIYGKDKASQDSDQVKLDIDSELRNAFEGKKFAAVIHRFEELPPGSTLIFYRYCDHENAAYKDVFLAFTVMLDTEVEVASNVNLGRVEEMVQEHVTQKFVSSDKLTTFNQMDVDKLSGLWSRISHLILPVAAEEKIEHQGCGGDCGESF